MGKVMQKERRLYKLFILSISTGSVFLTSGKFVNATNTPKFFFVVVLLLVGIIILAISKRGFNLGSITKDKILLWGIYSVLVIQAFYGICQFVGWLPSHHSKFAITGSFDNPAGFAALLSIGFPIGLFLLIKSKNRIRYLVVAGLMVIATSVFFSGSRAGMLALFVSSLVFILLQTNTIAKIKQFRYYKLFAVLSASIIIVAASLFYQQKKDSANGRLLIWQVSGTMIKDKPLFGHGYGAFKAKYMDYQANYFKNNPESRYKLLADNVKHPFNEFIKIAVEFGLLGLTVFLSVILFVI